MLFPIVATSM